MVSSRLPQPGTELTLSTGMTLKVQEPRDEVVRRIGVARQEPVVGLFEVTMVDGTVRTIVVQHVVMFAASDTGGAPPRLGFAGR